MTLWVFECLFSVSDTQICSANLILDWIIIWVMFPIARPPQWPSMVLSPIYITLSNFELLFPVCVVYWTSSKVMSCKANAWNKSSNDRARDRASSVRTWRTEKSKWLRPCVLFWFWWFQVSRIATIRFSEDLTDHQLFREPVNKFSQQFKNASVIVRALNSADWFPVGSPRVFHPFLSVKSLKHAMICARLRFLLSMCHKISNTRTLEIH